LKTPLETSPYNLLQEQLRNEPWKLLVACLMLNRTHNRQVKRVIDEFFKRYPQSQYFLYHRMRDEEPIKELIKPLGFKNRRYEALWKMTRDFSIFRPDLRPSAIHGLSSVGKYAQDSFKIFVTGELVEDVIDKKLKLYVDWAKTREITS
jgi:methyl-CpG-binding domain protein 4